MCAGLFRSLLCTLAAVLAPVVAIGQCMSVPFEGKPFTVCRHDPSDGELRLFHSDESGEPYGQFGALARDLAAHGQELKFAMNAGMYHGDRAPVGLYIEEGRTRAPLSLADGPGNFHLLPNGVFWADGETFGISESRAFAEAGQAVAHATQSGPMLVLDGELHPALRPASRSRYRRNAIGVSADGQTVWLAISEVPVNFHLFARLFRDHLGTPDALYLDGNISKLYAPALDRNERGLDMGPMIGVVVPSAGPDAGKETQ